VILGITAEYAGKTALGSCLVN